MKKFDFLIDGIPLSVYPADDPVRVREDVRHKLLDGELAVLLYPALDADFGACCFDKNNREPREPALSFAALSCFFSVARGYPKMSADVRYNQKVYELHISGEAPVIAVNSEKCKISYTKVINFADGIEVKAHIAGVDNGIISVVCRDSELFDGERLSVLLSSQEASAAVAVSLTDRIRIKSAGYPIFSDAVAAGIGALSAEGVCLPEGVSVAELDGREHKLFYSRGKLTFYPIVKFLY